MFACIGILALPLPEPEMTKATTEADCTKPVAHGMLHQKVPEKSVSL
jgi:hypothetical protein